MTEKHKSWINEFLVPYIVNKERECETVNDVHFKSSEIFKCDDDGCIFTVGYKINIDLNIDGNEKTLSVFVKVKSTQFVFSRI